MFATLELFYHNAGRLLFKRSDIIQVERRLPGRSLCSYMANVKSVVLIIGRGYTMRTRLRRDKRAILPTSTYLPLNACAVAAAAAAAPRPTYCLNNNFKRMSHCISDYSDLNPLNRDKTCLNMLLARRKSNENSTIEYRLCFIASCYKTMNKRNRSCPYYMENLCT